MPESAAERERLRSEQERLRDQLPGPAALLLTSRGYTVLQGEEHGTARTVLIYPPGIEPDYGLSLVGSGEDWTAADAFRQAYAQARAWSVEATASGKLPSPLPPLQEP